MLSIRVSCDSLTKTSWYFFEGRCVILADLTTFSILNFGLESLFHTHFVDLLEHKPQMGWTSSHFFFRWRQLWQPDFEREEKPTNLCIYLL